MSAALIGIASAVGHYTQAAPQNSTAIEASCKSNANKKSWCSEVPVAKPVPQLEQQQPEVPIVKPVPQPEQQQPIEVEPKQQPFQPPTSEPEPLIQPEQNQQPDSISNLEQNQPDLEQNQQPEPEQPINPGDEFDLNNTTVTEIVALNEQQLRLLSAEDIATLPIEVMLYFNADQFRYLLVNLTREAISGFTANHLAALNIDAMAAFDAQTIAELDPMAVKGFDVDQLFRLNPTVMAGFTTQQWENLAITRESPTLSTIPQTKAEAPKSAEIQLSSDVEAPLSESENIQLDNDSSIPSDLNREPTVTEQSEAIVTEKTLVEEPIATIEEPTATKLNTIESLKVAIVPEGTMNPIYSLEQKILIIPEVQLEVAGEVVSYEVKMEAIDEQNNMKLTAAQPIESKAQQGIVMSTLSLETGELIIPLIEMVDSLGGITSWQVQLQWIQFNPLIFKINYIYYLNLLNHTDVVKEVMN
ncbi:hypothetical protein THII_3811 [Thioploca ingrica]|uniref:Uncharacterized protein n=1 Tax=Thioploca ingrica TaxID=40754 RepID=A0A090AI91_9GAMM|nr:hypothetical protein THII_3811 [Thioploca ingrica]